MATILITGGTGMIGTRLTEMLADRGYDVIILTRDTTKHQPSPGVSYASWDINAQAIDRDAIGKADHIIHLAGAGVADKRWSQARKQEILRSRTESSALIVKALKEYPNKVQSVISSSAIGWYGPDTARSLKEGFTEDAPADTAFLGETCRQWEASIEPVAGLGKRLVKLRTGIVLSNRGGALAEFRKPVMGGVAAILGNGNQVVSWIHVEDLCSMFLFVVENHSLAGAYNAVAPNPVTNKTLTLTIAQKLRGRFYIPVYVPAFILKIVLGEMSIEVLKSANVSARKIQQAGFDFSYPVIDQALDNLLAR